MKNLGQLIFTGIKGFGLEEDEKSFLKNEGIGGVVLFSRNFESVAQLCELINSIQTLREDYPLFIAVDHEGGRVVRFKKHFSPIPPMLSLGKSESPKICYEVSKIMADELSACGVNLNLAPVCDILLNPSNKVIGDRSFGSDVDLVCKYVTAAIRGFQTNNIISCAKHFPGHGSTVKDSHLELPIVKTSLDEFRKGEFIPFIKAVKSRVEFVMMAHLQVDSIDEKFPISLSKKAHDILRSELKFKKIIISDDMTMKAITNKYAVKEAALLAMQAGTDIVEYRDMEVAAEALEGIKEAYKTKELNKDFVEQKISRIFDCKKSYLKEYRPVFIPDVGKKINTPHSQQFLKTLQERIEDYSS